AYAAARPPPRGRALPSLRHHPARRPLRGLRDRVLPHLPDGWARAQGPAPVAAAALTVPSAAAPLALACPMRSRRRHRSPASSPHEQRIQTCPKRFLTITHASRPI